MIVLGCCCGSYQDDSSTMKMVGRYFEREAHKRMTGWTEDDMLRYEANDGLTPYVPTK